MAFFERPVGFGLGILEKTVETPRNDDGSSELEGSEQSRDTEEQKGDAGDRSCTEGDRRSLIGRNDNTLRRRYTVREDEDGRYITCIEAPNVNVRVVRGLTVTGASAKRAPSGTIYLDGAAACEPFMDVQKGVYNLDHHEGCVRPFTLATCEQAMVLALKGLDLRAGEWTVWANEPDLDTVLAIWVLLNHMRLSDDSSEVRQAIMPLLRLEGVIDANGLRFTELCGFPKEHQEKTKAILDELYDLELEVKEAGRWGTVDFAEYTADLLRAIDTLYYSPCLFEETPEIEEMIRVPITDNRMAVICRAETGIYEVEKGLAHLHGNSIGLIILQKNGNTYTLRQVDPFLPISLDALYERLNVMDPSADEGGEANRWGGSAEIGGSPRRTGTALRPNEISRVVNWVYHPPRPILRAGAVAVSAAASFGIPLLALGVAYIYSENAGSFGYSTLVISARGGLFATVLTTLSLAVFLAFGLRKRRRVGLRLPAGWKWLLTLPLAVLVGLLGGAWVLPPALVPTSHALGYALLFPAVSELLHRGFVHGYLRDFWNVMRSGGRWFLSKPTLIAGVFSAGLSSLLFLPQLLLQQGGVGYWLIPLWLVGALVVGLGAGVARERSGSLIPALLLHLLAALWSVFLPSLI